MTIIEILLIPILFLIVTAFTYWLTEYDNIPKWLHYKPFICNKCLTFWSLLGVGISLFLLDFIITGVALIVLGVLNAIAKHEDEKENTVVVENTSNKVQNFVHMEVPYKIAEELFAYEIPEEVTDFKFNKETKCYDVCLFIYDEKLTFSDLSKLQEKYKAINISVKYGYDRERY